MPDRRSFLLKAVNLAIGGVIGLAMGVPILRYLIFPTKGKVVAGPDGFVPVTSLAEVPEKGPPLRVQIVAPHMRDAWTKIENVSLGAAWIVRRPDGKPQALSTTCPHLGCAIDYDAGANEFRCPCHTSAFSAAGERLHGPARRGMFELETQVDDKGRVLVSIATDRAGADGGKKS